MAGIYKPQVRKDLDRLRPIAITPYKMRIPSPCLPTMTKCPKDTSRSWSIAIWFKSTLTAGAREKETRKDLAENTEKKLRSIARRAPMPRCVRTESKKSKEAVRLRMILRRMRRMLELIELEDQCRWEEPCTISASTYLIPGILYHAEEPYS